MLFAHSPIRAIRQLVTGLSMLAFALPMLASAAPATRAADNEYKQERAACMSGQSSEDQATCLKEAAAARGEARRGRLDNGQESLYEQNAQARCKVLPAADREDCVRRVHGEGTVSGSVESGGIFRETRTTIVEPQPVTPPREDTGIPYPPSPGSGMR